MRGVVYDHGALFEFDVFSFCFFNVLKMRLINFICCVCLVFCAFCVSVSVHSQNRDKLDGVDDYARGNNVVLPVDKLPQYPGGEEALMAFLSANVIYPTEAAEMGIQGRVIVMFVVDTSGNVPHAEIMQSVDSLLDAEALRVVKLLKGWTPAKKNGKAVDTWMALPVVFRLKKEQTKRKYVWEAEPIDSLAYEQMMNLGLKAQSENNLPHAKAYFKEAYHINPYSIDPLERIVKMNDEHKLSEENYSVYQFGMDQLLKWNEKYGTGSASVFPMEWLVEHMNEIVVDDFVPQITLLLTYVALNVNTTTYDAKILELLDKIIPQCKDMKMWPEYGSMMVERARYCSSEQEVIDILEPNAEDLGKSKEGAVALVVLSEIYDGHGDTKKAAQFLNMAKEADPEEEMIGEWLK